MANPQNPIAGATAPPAGAPGPEVSQPYFIPAGMSPEQAAVRSKELIGDPDFAARYMKGGADSKEGRELHALQRHAVGMAPDKPVAPRDENVEAVRALGAPTDISGYDLSNIRGPDGGFVHMDEPMRKLANSELLPAARGLDLSQSDVAMIASTVASPMSYEQCESVLHKLWPGKEFERGLNDFRLAMAANPKASALIEQYIELSNSPMLISAVVAAYRRRQLRG